VQQVGLTHTPTVEALQDPWGLPMPKLPCKTRLKYHELVYWACILHLESPFTMSRLTKAAEEWYEFKADWRKARVFITILVRNGYITRQKIRKKNPVTHVTLYYSTRKLEALRQEVRP